MKWQRTSDAVLEYDHRVAILGEVIGDTEPSDTNPMITTSALMSTECNKNPARYKLDHIPSPNAYPSVEIISSSKFGEVGSFLSYREPNLAELKWLVAALKAVTKFHPALKLQVKNKILVPRDSFEEVTMSGELSVPTTARDYLQEKKSAVVVRVSYPPKSSIADMPNFQEGNDGGPPPKLYSAFRQCVKCMKALPPSKAARCGGCKAVFYCGTVCQKKDWKIIHRDECRKYKEMMDRAGKLVIKELSFPAMDFEEPCSWLEETEVHQKGMWRRLCKCYQSCPFGHLPTGSMAGGSVLAAAWGLENGKFPPDRPLEIRLWQEQEPWLQQRSERQQEQS
ncbi:hypothetical protein R1sor_008620 [Riccia sorocarpa]|uniref:MYND-type domain-containing protein n=1 Tax=Riccia sorocarpa TaxID=122646 RepID=A0ABD3I067_9MARC